MSGTALEVVFRRLAAEQDAIASELSAVLTRLVMADEHQLAIHVADLIEHARLTAGQFRRLAVVVPDLAPERV